MNSHLSLDVTGLDSGTLIQELMNIERRPLTVLQNKQVQLAEKKGAWSTVKSKIDSLLTKMKSLLGETPYHKLAVQLNNSSVVSASVTGSAVTGNYEIEVESLATAHILHSQIFCVDPNDSLDFSGTLTLGFGENLEYIEYGMGDTSDSLNSIAAKINGIKELGIKASVLQVGHSEYRMVLVAESTGQEITIENSGDGSLFDLDSEEMNVRLPSNAAFKINGVEFEWDSNHVADAIPGVILDLLEVGTTRAEVNYDDDALVAAVQEFVDEYNSFVDLTAKYTSWNNDTKKAGLLFGDPLLQRLVNSIQQTIFKEFSDKSENFKFAGAIGISTGKLGSFLRDGKIMLDESKFKEALSENRDAVASLLGNTDDDSAGILSSLRQVLQTYAAYDGLLPLRESQIDSQSKDITRQIENMERRLEMRFNNLKRQFAGLESLLMQMNSQGAWLSQQIQALF